MALAMCMGTINIAAYGVSAFSTFERPLINVDVSICRTIDAIRINPWSFLTRCICHHVIRFILGDLWHIFKMLRHACKLGTPNYFLDSPISILNLILPLYIANKYDESE